MNDYLVDGRALDYLPVAAPARGELAELPFAIRWLRFPLPYRLKHINIWIMDADDGLVIIDTGVADKTSKSLWKEIFPRFDRKRPQQLIVTHNHPDHIGLAGWLCEQWQVPLSMTRAEWFLAQLFHVAEWEVMQNLRFYRQAGCDEALLSALANHEFDYANMVGSIPASFRPLADGEVLTINGSEWRVIVASGHSPALVCLYCKEADILIAADQVLPRITPNLAVLPYEPEADPISEYLQSLDKLKRLPADTLVLPSHGEPFRGLHVRIDELASHHEARLALLLEEISEPRTAAALSTILFTNDLNGHDRLFAVWETLAHLRHLEAKGSIMRTSSNGLEYYVRT